VAAESRLQRQTTWEGLTVVVGHTVRIVMPDGAHLEGKATAVEVDALAIEIHKTTNKTTYPKGKFLVPRATLKAVDVNQPTRRWRTVGLGVGGGVGAVLAVLAISIAKDGFQTRHPVEAALTAGAVAVPVGGYLLGRQADRRTVTYVIAP
jgi:F0F1-type ATP synthase beta subunit